MYDSKPKTSVFRILIFDIDYIIQKSENNFISQILPYNGVHNNGILPMFNPCYLLNLIAYETRIYYDSIIDMKRINDKTSIVDETAVKYSNKL